MGECKMQLGLYKEAIQYFSTVVRTKPKNIAGWEALIRCLYNAEYFTEAQQQVLAALRTYRQQTLFIYYLSAVLFALGKSKEALLHWKKRMTNCSQTIKKICCIFNPSILQNQQVVDVIARNKRVTVPNNWIS